SRVKLFSISRDRFIQILFKDSQLHHRMLQLMVRRLRQTNLRLEMRLAPPAVKLAHSLITLGENCGQENNKEIFNIPFQDLADVTEISLEETTKIMEKLAEKNWIAIDEVNQVLRLVNFKQLTSLASRV
ncbi:MAG: Crp/Fnr family transcriptional regulator, partial [Cyanobacteria bacterium J06639_18]